MIGNSDQQASQIGIEENRGRVEPQRAQGAGSIAQLKLSKGLRSTRTTARQRAVSDGGTSVVRLPESSWKTHRASGRSKINVARQVSIAHRQIYGFLSRFPIGSLALILCAHGSHFVRTGAAPTAKKPPAMQALEHSSHIGFRWMQILRLRPAPGQHYRRQRHHWAVRVSEGLIYHAVPRDCGKRRCTLRA